MVQKAVREAIKWQIIGMMDGSRISNREIASRLLTLKNYINTLNTDLFKNNFLKIYLGTISLKIK